ncbi:hypothetical protein [Actinokineospora sp. NBRC 105648]|uniref:hypothetical protein n=1 Tax=Actinokineospora sp. NBRC 105648 TaxID=3032206 RepID=UPI0024A50EEB|nr:hypothetical protein [Actinokineospora sp. NBRC 105648]GLZ39879.1 hypothetical protein Acsp05_35030 [Actinokineospora sp. NBRC 105648]
MSKSVVRRRASGLCQPETTATWRVFLFVFVFVAAGSLVAAGHSVYAAAAAVMLIGGVAVTLADRLLPTSGRARHVLRVEVSL